MRNKYSKSVKVTIVVNNTFLSNSVINVEKCVYLYIDRAQKKTYVKLQQ